jgi:hypothetical protein
LVSKAVCLGLVLVVIGRFVEEVVEEVAEEVVVGYHSLHCFCYFFYFAKEAQS